MLLSVLKVSWFRQEVRVALLRRHTAQMRQKATSGTVSAHWAFLTLPSAGVPCSASSVHVSPGLTYRSPLQNLSSDGVHSSRRARMSVLKKRRWLPLGVCVHRNDITLQHLSSGSRSWSGTRSLSAEGGALPHFSPHPQQGRGEGEGRGGFANVFLFLFLFI